MLDMEILEGRYPAHVWDREWQIEMKVNGKRLMMTRQCDICKESGDCEITLFHTHHVWMCKKCRDTPPLRLKVTHLPPSAKTMPGQKHLYSIHYYPDYSEDDKWAIIKIDPVRKIDVMYVDWVRPHKNSAHNTCCPIYWNVKLWREDEESAMEAGKKRILDDIPKQR